MDKIWDMEEKALSLRERALRFRLEGEYQSSHRLEREARVLDHEIDTTLEEMGEV